MYPLNDRKFEYVSYVWMVFHPFDASGIVAWVTYGVHMCACMCVCIEEDTTDPVYVCMYVSMTAQG